DAAIAASLDADAVGMVFHPASARCIDLETARGIIAALPAFVTPVGLFVDANVDEVRAAARELSLRHIQLHGHEDAKYIAALKDFVILKGVRVQRDAFEKEMVVWRGESARFGLANLGGLILETPSAEPGGTGLVNDWAFVRACQQRGMFEGLPAI